MAHQGIPRILYEHPVVEYIHLAVTTVLTGPLPPAKRAEIESGRPSVDGERLPFPSLLALDSPEAWRSAMRLCRFAFPPISDLPPLDTPLAARRELHLLALGFRVTGGIYRGRKVSLATSAHGPVFHLFTLPLKYFYKPAVDFYAYTSHGARLAEAMAVPVVARGRRG